MTGTVTGVWSARRTDLDPEWARTERPWLYRWCPDDPVDVLIDDVDDRPAGFGEEAARRIWVKLYAPTQTLVHQDVTYGDWREPAAADVRAARTDDGARQGVYDWAVRLPGGQVDRQDGSYDAARRRAYDAWPLVVRDVTWGPWTEVAP